MFHGGHPSKPVDDFDDVGLEGWQWPWGNAIDPTGCNCLNFPLNDPTPQLRHVRRRYGWHEGKTVHGVLNMAGNAAEWVDNWIAEVPLGPIEGRYHARNYELRGDKKELIPGNFAAGGSYIAGIEDCGLPLNATYDKCAREVHVGFRLIIRDPGLGG